MWNEPQSSLSPDAKRSLTELLQAWKDCKEEGVSVQHVDALESRLLAHVEGAIVAPWMVTLGTSFGTDAMTHWDDVTKAMAHTCIHPSTRLGRR